MDAVVSSLSKSFLNGLGQFGFLEKTDIVDYAKCIGLNHGKLELVSVGFSENENEITTAKILLDMLVV